MTRKDKLKRKLLRGSAFTWPELCSLLDQLGYVMIEGSGSRVKFIRGNSLISLHGPTPAPN